MVWHISPNRRCGGSCKWTRRRLRSYLWRQWGNGHNRFNELRRRGVSQFRAAVAAGSPTGFWRMSGHPRGQSYLPLPIVRAFTHRSRLGLSVAPPFGLECLNQPCRLHGLLCPLLTPAPRSGPLAVPSAKVGTWRRPPWVSSIAFPAPLPNLQPWPLMNMDFAVRCPLVRPEMPHIRFLFVRPRFCSALPSDITSR